MSTSQQLKKLDKKMAIKIHFHLKVFTLPSTNAKVPFEGKQVFQIMETMQELLKC